MSKSLFISGLAVTLFAACGGGSKFTTTPATSPISSASTSTSTSTPTTTPRSTTTADNFTLPIAREEALLRNEEVARFGLHKTVDTEPVKVAQSYCGEGIVTEIAGYDVIGSLFETADGAQNLEETLWGWATEAHANQAFELNRSDFGCRSGRFEGDNTPYTIVPLALDTTYGDESFAYIITATYKGTPIKGVFVGVRVDNFLIQFIFTAAEGAGALDVDHVVAVATDKVTAAT